MDEIIKEVAEVFDLPPARAKVIVEMVASRLQSGSTRSGCCKGDGGHDEHRSDEHRSDEHRSDEHRGGEHRGGEHRGGEHRGDEHRGGEHRGGEGGHGSGKPAKKGGLRGLLGDVGGMLGGE